MNPPLDDLHDDLEARVQRRRSADAHDLAELMQGNGALNELQSAA